MLPFEINAQNALIAAGWTFAAAALVWAEILRLRYRQAREARVAREVTARWHPILSLASFGILPASLPVLRKEERDAFLRLWTYLQMSLRGDARSTLTEIARQLDCDAIAMRMLARGHRGERLLATLVAGHLGLEPALPALVRLAESRDSVLSLQGLQAVLRIRPAMASRMLTLCLRREDWPISELLPTLRPASDVLHLPLAAELDARDERVAQRAIRLAAGLQLAINIETQRRLLCQLSPLLLTESFALITQPALKSELRVALSHADKGVRAMATEALSRLGDTSDLPRLAALLCDSSWQVRNSAARAIVAVPGGGTAALRSFADACNDRYGRNIAEQVLAEISLGS